MAKAKEQKAGGNGRPLEKATRIEMRIEPARKARYQRAAVKAEKTLSDFAFGAMDKEADRVLGR